MFTGLTASSAVRYRTAAVLFITVGVHFLLLVGLYGTVLQQ